MSEDASTRETWSTQTYGLDKRLVKACKKAGWVSPTLVQRSAIPLILKGKDVLCRARTGAGKTAAYLLPLLQKILERKAGAGGDLDPAVRALILVPTNELCQQVSRQLDELTYYCSDVVAALSLAPAANGAEKKASRSKSSAIKAQAVLLRSCPDIVVATPARANVHLGSGALVLSASGLETLVVDEADLVLSFGHGDDMRAIVAALPEGAKGVQGILMSATLSPQLAELKKLVLHSPAILKLNEGDEGPGSGRLLQFYVPIAPADKYLLVYVFLRLGLLQGKGILFVNSIDEAYRLRLFLSKFTIRAAALNSELPLTSRTHILDEFNRGIFDLLIATDEGLSAAAPETDSERESDADNADDDGVDCVSDFDDEKEEEDKEEEDKEEEEEEEEEEDNTRPAKKAKAAAAAAGSGDDEYGVARGVDFRGVAFVVNVDMPRTAEAYTHRIGRTARAGANGTSLTLVSTDRFDGEAALLAEVQALQPPLPAMGGDSVLAAMGPQAGVTGASFTAQPAPLAFDLSEVDAFRYRVEDVLRSVSKTAVREERAAELKREMLNSERLTEYFALNPNDLKTLRHDKRAVPSNKQDNQHLAHVPQYLVPMSLRAIGGDASRQADGRKRRRHRAGAGGSDPRRNKAADPLQSFTDGQSTADADSAPVLNDKIYTKSDDTGVATSGRRLWKMKHHKGEFSKKKRVGGEKVTGYVKGGSWAAKPKRKF